VDAKLGRAVLAHVEDHPEQFDMSVWGESDPVCGATACLAGWALILSDWELAGDGTFKSPDGKREAWHHMDIEREAQTALALTDDEYWADGDTDCLFTLPEDAAVKRLRELVEGAEAVSVNG
jgi:hypothetical protein